MSRGSWILSVNGVDIAAYSIADVRWHNNITSVAFIYSLEVIVSVNTLKRLYLTTEVKSSLFMHHLIYNTDCFRLRGDCSVLLGS